MKMDMTKIRNHYNPNGFFTKPFGFIYPNGLNFRYSIKNKNSRLFKMLTYLHENSDSLITKNDILVNVFHKTVVDSYIYNGHTHGFVTRGWGTYLFSLSVKCGFVRFFRKGNKVYYVITEKGKEVIGI